MESKNHQTTILNIECVELYQIKNDASSVLQTGPLSVVYLSASNSFVVKIGDFKYYLSKEIVIQALIPRDDDTYPSYIFSNPDGNYTIKIVTIASPEALSTLETLLNNHCTLTYESEPAKETVKTKDGGIENSQKTKMGLLARMISFGGEISKTGMIKSAEIFSSGISKAGDFVQKRYITAPEEKEVSGMTMYKLKAAGLATSMTRHATNIPAQGLLYAGKQVVQKVNGKILDSKFGSKHHDTIAEIGNSALYATACIYDGFTEALSIFGSGVADTTTKLVTQKYGEQVGDATKEGMNVLGNVGKIVNLFKDDAVKIIEEHTEKNSS